jgi:hypothetical protein
VKPYLDGVAVALFRLHKVLAIDSAALATAASATETTDFVQRYSAQPN